MSLPKPKRLPMGFPQKYGPPGLPYYRSITESKPEPSIIHDFDAWFAAALRRAEKLQELRAAAFLSRAK